MPVSRHTLRGLYAITPDDPDTDRLRLRVEQALTGGAALIQYRNKQADAALRMTQVRRLAEVCRKYGVALVINDDLDLAAALGLGVHVGAKDADVAAARTRLGPEAIVGASCYDDVATARRAVAQGASYIAFGAFHPSPTKPEARRASPDLLRASRALGVPRVAIGGIRTDNARALIEAGADLLAVISDLFDASDIVGQARRYSAFF